MKKLLIVLCLVLTLTFSATAHGGGTDGSGGHYDRSTGEYHYHHGYSEHDHYDVDGDGDVDCPYDFVNNTRPSSSTNSYSNNYSDSNSKVEPEIIEVEAEVPVEVEVPFIPTWIKWCLVLAAIAIIWLILYLISQKKETSLRIQKLNHLHEQELEPIKYLCKTLSYEERIAWIRKVSRVPENDRIGLLDKLPYSIDDSGLPWGEKYTFGFYSHFKNGKYHKPSCQYCRGNYINAYNLGSCSPCAVCGASKPDMQWVDKYLALDALFDKYAPQVKQDLINELNGPNKHLRKQ